MFTDPSTFADRTVETYIIGSSERRPESITILWVEILFRISLHSPAIAHLASQPTLGLGPRGHGDESVASQRLEQMIKRYVDGELNWFQIMYEIDAGGGPKLALDRIERNRTKFGESERLRVLELWLKRETGR